MVEYRYTDKNYKFVIMAVLTAFLYLSIQYEVIGELKTNPAAREYYGSVFDFPGTMILLSIMVILSIMWFYDSYKSYKITGGKRYKQKQSKEQEVWEEAE